MSDQFPEESELEPLSRTQILVAMGVTAVLLLIVARLWVHFSQIAILSLQWSGVALLMGIGLGVGITLASSLVYSVWGAYRQSADYYLKLVLKPLVWVDLVWLGLLPGMSEELLFRGVMLPFFGLDLPGLFVSSLCFGVLHMSSWKQWSYVVWATVIGLVLGASAIYTGNLLVPIVAHISTNLISSTLWKWGQLKRSKAAS